MLQAPDHMGKLLLLEESHLHQKGAKPAAEIHIRRQEGGWDVMGIGINRRLMQNHRKIRKGEKSVGLHGIPGSSDPALLQAPAKSRKGFTPLYSHRKPGPKSDCSLIVRNHLPVSRLNLFWASLCTFVLVSTLSSGINSSPLVLLCPPHLPPVYL